ncbi:type II secretion system protein [Pseudidiomarina salilacus]|uniref:type II secretion system protein n=1 Tax=Pseudidiomarina salilacus TaxID=3384452 RepID=UPI0039849D03
MNQQKGFTLIELIIVIVVLGILAVTAAPQFINFQSDARASTVEGAKASVQGAMQLAYAKSLIEGEEDSATASVETENGIVSTVYGYPAYEADSNDTTADGGIALAAGLNVDATTGEWVVSGSGPIQIRPASADATADCYVEYTEASATSPAKVTSNTDNC